jgi:probable phosphoglycerate mutase
MERAMLSEAVAAPTVLWVIRHGRTRYNAEGRLRGLDDPPLDDVGRLEAAALGRMLADRPLAAVLTSPLSRAVQTATAVADPHGLPVTVDPDLRDRDYGPWTGAARSAVEARFGTLDNAPGVEPARAVAARMWRACRRALAANSGLTVAVVTHDAGIRLLLADLLGVAPDDVRQQTGAVNELLVDPSGARVVGVDARPGDQAGR